MKFTDRGIATLKAKSERFEVWEDGRTGFGMRVSTRGRKSWLYMYRFNSKARRMTLGTYPRTTLAEARLAFANAKERLSLGEDPGIAHVQQNRESRAAPTVSDLANLYLDKWARPRKRSASEDERILMKDVVPAWEGLKVHAVTRRHVAALLDRIVERGAPIQANRTLAVIRKMFNFAVSRSIVETNPCVGISTPAKENQRDRVLNDKEIAAFWHALDDCTVSEPVAIALKLQLVTAQRKQEVVETRWNEIDFDNGMWTIPAERSKNGKSHRVPVSPLALELLERLRVLNPDSEWLFPAKTGDKSITERAIDRAVGRNRDAIGVEHFTPHDLRRTAASFMTMLGFSRFVVERILNHADRSVAAVYDRYSYDKEKREALAKWSSKLVDIVRA